MKLSGLIRIAVTDIAVRNINLMAEVMIQMTSPVFRL